MLDLMKMTGGNMSSQIKICFVCLGNIVRSPLAENLFRFMVVEAGLEGKYQVDSAGTSAYHIGEKPDRRMRQVAAGHGFKYSGRARQFSLKDLQDFDLIIPMDESNQRNLLRLSGSPEDSRKIYLMRTFDPQGSPQDPVPDPYYGGIDGFENTYQIVIRSCRGLLEALEKGEVP
jgi:protein-tyrosine phosphatase